MSVHSETFYDIRCDHPGCTVSFTDELWDGEAGWIPRRDLDEAWRDEAQEHGWKSVGDEHFCSMHADLHGEPPTEPPFVDPTPNPDPLFETEKP